MPGVEKKRKHYVNNKEFVALLDEYREHKDPKVWEKLGAIFHSIAKRRLLSFKLMNFPNEVKEDMISNAVVDLLETWHKFDTSRINPNPFSYFTTCVNNSYNLFLSELNKDNSVMIGGLHNILSLLENETRGTIESEDCGFW